MTKTAGIITNPMVKYVARVDFSDGRIIDVYNVPEKKTIAFIQNDGYTMFRLDGLLIDTTHNDVIKALIKAGVQQVEKVSVLLVD